MASDLRKLAEAGTQRIGIPLDAATEDIFAHVKGENVGGPYRWKKQFQMLEESLHIFGKENVSTHLIVGLGETEQEMVKIIQECVNICVLPGLFAFTPVRGTRLQDIKPPTIQKYRRIQIARFLIMSKTVKFENMRFVDGHITDFGVSEEVLRRVIGEGEAFRTSGCPDCNRPYYNERPAGPLYNYPNKPRPEELLEIREQMGPS
jgi:biotin synthase